MNLINRVSPQDAYDGIHRGREQEILKSHISQWFTWGEVFRNCTDAEILAAEFFVYKNAALHASATMDHIRDHFNRPVITHCWYRGNIVKDRHGKTHDIEAGGTGKGEHPKGLAADFHVDGFATKEGCIHVYNELDKLPFMRTCGWEYPRDPHNHVDSRGSKVRF